MPPLKPDSSEQSDGLYFLPSIDKDRQLSNSMTRQHAHKKILPWNKETKPIGANNQTR